MEFNSGFKGLKHKLLTHHLYSVPFNNYNCTWLKVLRRKEVTEKRTKLGVSKISRISVHCKGKQLRGMW